MLNVAHDRYDLKPLQFGVDSVESTNKVFEEQFEGLGQTEPGLAGNHEGRDLFSAVVDNLAFVGCGVVGGHLRGRTVPEGPVHELVHAGGELVEGFSWILGEENFAIEGGEEREGKGGGDKVDTGKT